ncbi:MAG: thioredoxin domain-containing protein, partial [Polyangiaceae bacterium]
PLAPPSAEVAAPRSPALIRQQGNHLVGSASAYLREHAHNPVDWYPWGPEALALAKKLDRPIFLSIGYVSCHWCHVMEHEVFEQDDVAAFLNAHFISIKVDREERPDLDAVYMAAVQAMTGSGGWPMTVLLTPSLQPFFGGTYFPHQEFLEVVQAGAQQFTSQRSAVESEGAAVYRRISASEPAGAQPALTDQELHALAQRALGDLDPKWGGFRGRSKFPTPTKWRFLLDAYRKWGDAELAQAVRQTLTTMAEGGLRDQVAGGFFRYSTEPTWTVPHFEKMLYDNAQLASLYLEAAAALDEPRYRVIGLDTLDFIVRDFSTPEHAFGSSFDADAGGKEGASYLWHPAQIRSLLGEADGARIATLLGVSETGNFEGASIPTFRASESLRASTQPLWATSRSKLLEARSQRVQPAFDPKLVSAWNGLALSALALGYRASGDDKYRAAAESAAKSLWALNHAANGGLLRASDQTRAGSPAVLDDYGMLANGLIDLFQATGVALYLEQATTLVTEALTRFSSPSGAWYLTAGAEQEPLGRRIETYDGVEPSGNAALIAALQKLSALTGRDDLEQAATRALASYAGALRQNNLDMAGWLDAALLADGPFYEVVIAGDNAALAAAWRSLLPAWAVGVGVSRAGPTPNQIRVMPTAAGKTAPGGARAYVCVHGACNAPTTDPAQLRRQLLAGWLH